MQKSLRRFKVVFSFEIVLIVNWIRVETQSRSNIVESKVITHKRQRWSYKKTIEQRDQFHREL